MNFLEQPLNYTRTRNVSQSPAEYASSVQRFEPSYRAADIVIAVMFVAVACAVALGWLS